MDQETLMNQINNINIQVIILLKLVSTNQKTMSTDDIMDLAEIKMFDEEIIKIALKIMLSRGVITQEFNGGQIIYKITEFGNYFFEQLCKNNPNFKELLKR